MSVHRGCLPRQKLTQKIAILTRACRQTVADLLFVFVDHGAGIRRATYLCLDCAKNVDKNWNITVSFIIHMNFDHAWAEHYPVTLSIFVAYIQRYHAFNILQYYHNVIHMYIKILLDKNFVKPSYVYLCIAERFVFFQCNRGCSFCPSDDFITCACTQTHECSSFIFLYLLPHPPLFAV